MANRFNQLISQQYVPIPFQEVAQAAAIRQKTADTNAGLMDKELSDLNSLKAIPGTPQEQYAKEYLAKVNEAFAQYSSPEKLSNPNNFLEFRRHVRSITDPIKLNNIKSSWDNWQANTTYEKELARDQRFDERLRPDVSGLAPDQVFNQWTMPFDQSTKYTDPIYTGFEKNGVIRYNPDGSTFVSTERSKENLETFAELQKEEVAQAPWLKAIARTAKGMSFADFDKMSPEDKQSLAKEVLMGDWHKYITKTEGAYKNAPRKALGLRSGGDKEEAAPEIVDPAGNLVYNRADDATWTPKYLQTAFNTKYNANDPVVGGQSSIVVNPSKSFNVMPIRGNVDPRVVQLRELLTKANADVFKSEAEKSEAFKKFDTTMPIHYRYSRAMLPLREKIMALAKDLGLPEEEFDIMGRNTSKSFEHLYVNNLMMDKDVLAKVENNFNKQFGVDKGAFDSNVGGDTKVGTAIKMLSSGRFITRDTENKVDVDDPISGRTSSYVLGDFVKTKAELNSIAKEAGFDDADEMLERIAEVEERLGYKKGELLQSGNPITKVNEKGETHEFPTYKIQGYIPVPTSNDVMDEFNRGELGDKYNSEMTNKIHALRAARVSNNNRNYSAGLEWFNGDILKKKEELMTKIDALTKEDFDEDFSDAEVAELKKKKKDAIEEALKTGKVTKLGEEINELNEVVGNKSALMESIGDVESAGQYNTPPVDPDNGSASGKYQFIKSTWQAYARKLGIDKDEAYKATAEEQDRVMKAHIKDNSVIADKLLQQYKVYQGFPFDKNDLMYLLHAVGAGDLPKMLDAYVQNAGSGHAAGLAAMEELDKHKERKLSQTIEQFRKKLK